MADNDKVAEPAKAAAPAKRAPRKAPAAKKPIAAKAPLAKSVPAKPVVAAKGPTPKAAAPEVTAPKVAKSKAAVAKPKVEAAKPAPAEPAMPEPTEAAAPAVAAVIAETPAAIPAPAEILPPVTKAAPKTAPTHKPTFAGFSFHLFSEENTMDMSPNFAGMQDAITEAQTKAKAAFEKSSAMLGEVSNFTKGNVEAIIESGKILAEGMQGMGTEMVSESRSAFETLTGDIKELAAAKSPTDFFKLQGEMVRKNFDSAVAYGSKSSETVLKLASDVIAPISGRVSLAMEKARSVSM